MRLAKSGSRGVYWRTSPRGTQEARRVDRTKERGDWWVRWACTHGHVHRVQVGPKGLAQREAERHRVERPCPMHLPKTTRHLLADVIREYLDESKVSKRSYRDDARYARAWIQRLGGRALDEISPADLERIRAERLAGSKGGRNEEPRRPVKAATVNREFAFLKHLYNVAIRDGKIDKNPVTKVKLLREPSGRVRYLSDNEEQNLFKVLPTDEDRDRVRVLLQTGLRRSEFLGLRWKDTDFKAGVLTIPLSKHGDARHVPMTSEVRAILSRRARPLDTSALVFANSVGHADEHWAQKDFPEWVEAAGIEDFRLHDTRHTFASRLAMAAVDVLTIKELGGWKTLSMVQRYAHLSPGHQRQAIERLVTRQAPLQLGENVRTESHQE